MVLLAVNLVTNPANTATELAERCRESGVQASLARVTSADLATVRTALGEWLEVFDAPDEQSRVRLINEMLAKYTVHPG